MADRPEGIGINGGAARVVHQVRVVGIAWVVVGIAFAAGGVAGCASGALSVEEAMEEIGETGVENTLLLKPDPSAGEIAAHGEALTAVESALARATPEGERASGEFVSLLNTARGQAAALSAAARSGDREKFLVARDQLYATCEGCHEKFKHP
ncbi:MAG: cytochrome c [Planctomycetes bacterium]|nr:cytochrome c [Planctomycetota bacterium]